MYDKYNRSNMEIQLVDDEGMPETAFSRVRKELIVTTNEEGVLAERMGQRTKMHSPSDLMALAEYVQTADSHTKAIAGGKLELISNQIKMLQDQARKVLEDAKQDMELSHAKCNFQRRPGTIYHLYKKIVPGQEEMEVFFSMLSPLEWGGNPPQEYLNSYRLEYDMSWTPVDRVVQRDNARRFNAQLLGLTNSQVQNNDSHLQLTLN